jgi:hypothetical protein
MITLPNGLALRLLALLIRLAEKAKSSSSPLIVFGQTPLSFYIAHFYVLAACAFASFHEASSLEGGYLFWPAVLAAPYPAGARYRRFKISKPRESLWRLF